MVVSGVSADYSNLDWPWYMLWALGFAALSRSSRAVRLTLLLTASSLLIYPLFGYQGTEMWWGFNYRALVVWVLPLIGGRARSSQRWSRVVASPDRSRLQSQ